MSHYSEKLKDPRWQKKRLGVLERAGWKCDACDDGKRTLQIHHLIYSNGEPWDAPNETLECLCEPCHQWREEFNSFVGGRTVAPTRFCYAFLRLTGHRMPENPTATPMEIFVNFAKYICPQHLPEKWRLKNNSEIVVDNLG